MIVYPVVVVNYYMLYQNQAAYHMLYGAGLVILIIKIAGERLA